MHAHIKSTIICGLFMISDLCQVHLTLVLTYIFYFVFPLHPLIFDIFLYDIPRAMSDLELWHE